MELTGAKIAAWVEPRRHAPFWETCRRLHQRCTEDYLHVSSLAWLVRQSEMLFGAESPETLKLQQEHDTCSQEAADRMTRLHGCTGGVEPKDYENTRAACQRLHKVLEARQRDMATCVVRTAGSHLPEQVMTTLCQQ